MRILIYFSGIGGSLLILTGLLGLILEFKNNAVYFITGVAFLIILYLPLTLINRQRELKRIDKIIESYKKKVKKAKNIKMGQSANKGWSMNNSPFRNRKSGVSWGGGNIHAANARRGERK